MAAIRAWMAAHPKEGAALRRENPSYVFFREITGDGPIGAERVVLTPGRSLAVDRAFIPLGVPVWLEAQERFCAGDRSAGWWSPRTPAARSRARCAAICSGATASRSRGGAGAMNARGRYYLLLPRAVAARAGAALAGAD